MRIPHFILVPLFHSDGFRFQYLANIERRLRGVSSPSVRIGKGRNQGSSAGSILTGYWMVFLVTAASILKPGQKNRRGLRLQAQPGFAAASGARRSPANPPRPCPHPGHIGCVIEEEWIDELGRSLVRVSIEKPWSIESVAGETKFTVFKEQIFPG